MSERHSYGSIILRLLLDGTLDQNDCGNMLWGELLHVAAQNGVLIRVVDQLQTMGLEPRHFFYAAVKEMRARNQRKLATISRIGEQCVEANVDFIFAKALQNYPDMGGDIDLYVTSRSIDVDRLFLRGLKATPVKRNLRNRIDGTATYRLAGCESLLDVHHGRLGMLGEHKLYIGRIIGNATRVTAEYDEFLVPSAEDQLVLQALQRVVQRSYLRLSDVVATVKLLRRHDLNSNYVLNAAKGLNIFYGLGCYLSFVEHIHREVFGKRIVPRTLRSAMGSRKTSPIEYKDGVYRFPRLAVGSRDYANKFCSAVLAENWSVASRLSLLPVLGLTVIARKLRTS
ncbi:MAG TPA: nucleotidyltransferase family protein [Pyrinomonadaceae bacterium]|nr:nucleotidyltransferase family protein [Pyrinomonadaceae bacterium]